MVCWASPINLDNFSDSALCSTHSFSSRLGQCPLHQFLCSWCLCHSICISKTPAIPYSNWVVSSQIASVLCSGTLALSHSGKTQLFFTNPSFLPSDYYLVNLHYQVLLPAPVILAITSTKILCLDTQETFSGKSHHSPTDFKLKLVSSLKQYIRTTVFLLSLRPSLCAYLQCSHIYFSIGFLNTSVS